MDYHEWTIVREFGFSGHIHVFQQFLKLLRDNAKCKVCSLLEWCFIISIGVSGDHSQLRCTGFAGSH